MSMIILNLIRKDFMTLNVQINDAVIRTIGDISYDEITYFDNVTVYPAKLF